MFHSRPTLGLDLSANGWPFLWNLLISPWNFSDPARFSLAQGGKDRHPYPVPT